MVEVGQVVGWLAVGVGSADAAARLDAAAAAGAVEGVWDDRGRFVALGPREADALAAWVADRGVVRVAEVAAHAEALLWGGA